MSFIFKGICYEYDSDVENIFDSLHNTKIKQPLKAGKDPTGWSFEYHQDGRWKRGSATLGHGIVVNKDSVVIGLPIYNKIWPNRMGGIMKIKEKKFYRFDNKLDSLRDELKKTQKVTKKRKFKKSGNDDISNPYFGWSVIKGNLTLSCKKSLYLEHNNYLQMLCF